MKLVDIVAVLKEAETLSFTFLDGRQVPSHFHVTEVGKISKKFIDCGGTIRQESRINFQLWDADDYDHRLHPEKLLKIITLSQEKLQIDDQLEVEVEYQDETIGKYDLSYDQGHFVLIPQRTDCLAKDKCGIDQNPLSMPIKVVRSKTPADQKQSSCCSSDSNCC